MEQIDAGKVKQGSYIMIDDEPCRVKSVERSSPGKHGSAKYRIMAVGLFDKKTRSIIRSGGNIFMVPDINKRVGQVLSVQGNIIQVMDLQTYETFEMDRGDKGVKEGEEITYWDVNGRKVLEI